MKVWRDKDGSVINIGPWEFLYNDDADGNQVCINPIPEGAYEDDAEVIEGPAGRIAAENYQALRRSEYPPISDYLDAQAKKSSPDPVVVAAGEDQEEAYFAACLAVKAKYPKP